jgi:hypothetical protein
LGIIDVGQAPPQTGRLILRDVGYGVGLGAIVGTAVGALFLIDSGRPKNLLTGAAIGTLVGAGAGIVFGVIEGAVAERSSYDQGEASRGDVTVRFTLAGSEGSWIPVPALQGVF